MGEYFRLLGEENEGVVACEVASSELAKVLGSEGVAGLEEEMLTEGSLNLEGGVFKFVFEGTHACFTL